MLNDWQVMILDNGMWLLPVGVLVLAAFPWKHWNSLIDDEAVNESR